MSGSGSQHKSHHHGHRKPGSGRHGHRQQPEDNPIQPPVPRPLVAPQPPTFSFLFVVNTLELNDACERDAWGVVNPPIAKTGYRGETCSMVFRFRNGQVTPVPKEQNYFWVRGYQGVEGGIISGARWSSNSSSYPPNYFTPHATYTIFRGWKFRPIVFMESDASVHDVNEAEWNRMFHVLGFDQRPAGSNVSFARARGNLYAAGREADWVGKLVPNSYKNHFSHAMRSGGLGGPLALILGLMAISQPAGRELYPFLDPRYWRPDGTWHGPKWEFESCEPGPNSAPRGVVVHVCCDEDENMLGSTIESLRMMEDTNIIVSERS